MQEVRWSHRGGLEHSRVGIEKTSGATASLGREKSLSITLHVSVYSVMINDIRSANRCTSHAKIDMRTLLGLVPPKSIRNETTSKARSKAAQATGARKSEAVKDEKAEKAKMEANAALKSDEDASKGLA